MPRRFNPTEDDDIIYDEEDEVSEMYFILEGQIGIGYSMVGGGRSKSGIKIGK